MYRGNVVNSNIINLPTQDFPSLNKHNNASKNLKKYLLHPMLLLKLNKTIMDIKIDVNKTFQIIPTIA